LLPVDSALAVFHSTGTQLHMVQLLKDDFGGADGLQSVGAAALSPDGKFLYAISNAQRTLTTFAVGGQGKLTPLSSLTVPNGQTSVLIAPNGARLFLVEQGGHVRSYSRNVGTGALTLLRDGSSGVTNYRAVLAPDGASLLLLDLLGDRMTVVGVAADGTLSVGTPIINGQGGVSGLDGPIGAAFSPDGQSVYLAGRDGNALVVFDRNPTTGRLTCKQAVVNGVAGVSGLGTPTAVAVSSDGKFVFAAGAADGTIDVFGRNTTAGSADFGKLTFAQRLRDQSGGVSGLAGPNALLIGTGGRLFVSGSGSSLHPANIADFSVNTAAPPPATYQVGYDQMAHLTVNTGGQNDSVSIGGVTTPLSVSTGAGDDAVTILDTGATTAIDTGTDSDSIELRSTGANAVTLTGSGNVGYRLLGSASGSTVTVNGGAGADSIEVVGGHMFGTVNLHGGDPSGATGDALTVDVQGLAYTPHTLAHPAGTFQVGTGSVVHYDGMETPRYNQATPIASAGSYGPINEGRGATLSAAASSAPAGHTIVSYQWDLNGDGVFDDASGVSVTLTPIQMVNLGLGAGPTSRTISVRVTTDEGLSDVGSALLSIVPVAPTITGVSQNGPVIAGNPVTVTAAATAPAGSLDPITYSFDWNNDGVYDFSTNSASALHTFNTAGTYTIGVKATNAGGSATSSVSVQVTAAPAKVRTISGSALVAETSLYTLNLAASGPDTATIQDWAIHWGDGSISTPTGNPSSATHTYAAHGSYTITATAEDAAGITSANSLDVTVTHVSPTVSIAGAAQVSAGAAYQLNLSAAETGPDTITGWSINWGDGNIEQYAGDPSAVYHTYGGALPSVQVSASATDQDGSYAGNTLAVNIQAVTPTITLSGAAAVNEGSAYTLTLGAVSDANGPVSQYIVHWGDGNSDTYPAAGPVTHTYARGPLAANIAVDLVDPAGTHAAVATQSVQVNVVPPTIALSGTGSVPQGSSYALTLGAVTGVHPATQYIVHWGDGSSNNYTTAATVTHTYLAAGPQTITVDLVTDAGTYAAAGTQLVQVNAVSAVIALSGAASTPEGSAYTLTLGAVSDPGNPGTPPQVSQYIVHWGDGSDSTYTAAGPVTHTYADGPNNTTASVDVVLAGGTVVAGAGAHAVSVTNVAPTPAIGGAPAQAVAGSPMTLSASAIDPSAVDQSAGFTFAWTVTKNGAAFAAGTGSSFQFTPDGAASYVVTLSATDKDGGIASTSATITVATQDDTMVLEADPLDPTRPMLNVTGTSRDDYIFATPGSSAGSVMVTMGSFDDHHGHDDHDNDDRDGDPLVGMLKPVAQGWTLSVYLGNHLQSMTNLPLTTPLSRIAVNAGAGDDIVSVSGSLTVSAWINGGAGNDWLKGGGGNDVILGGAGNDTLLGGGGRDLLIGGAGQDSLSGGHGEDILVGGTTDHDQSVSALAAVMAEWSRTDLAAGARAAHLMGSTSGGNNGTTLLTGQTVHDDGARDDLTGGGGTDWFFYLASGAQKDHLHGDKKQDIKTSL
jgi:6-phosphogluconolactonase (cycloisomerase 2 family)/PKD repeat protein